MRQTTLTEQRRPLTKSACDKLTTTIAEWISKSCRPINIVEDEGFTEVLRVATGDPNIEAPQRRTIMTKIHGLYEAEKNKKKKDLAATEHVALTGDHWTSVSSDNYLGVAAHLITDKWKLKSFALTCMKTEDRHFAEACAEQFKTVASNRAIDQKTTTIGTDSARNMLAAARLLSYEHMPCIAHILQRSIT